MCVLYHSMYMRVTSFFFNQFQTSSGRFIFHFRRFTSSGASSVPGFCLLWLLLLFFPTLLFQEVCLLWFFSHRDCAISCASRVLFVFCSRHSTSSNLPNTFFSLLRLAMPRISGFLICIAVCIPLFRPAQFLPLHTTGVAFFPFLRHFVHILHRFAISCYDFFLRAIL